jgi:predicted nucleotidyltransferase
VDDRAANEAPPEVVADEVLTALGGVLGSALRALVGHGSWVHGDFAPGRSDLDLLAVLDSDPTRGVLDRLAPLLDAIVQRHPGWADRLEVGLVSPNAIEDVLRAPGARHMAGRISPGEPLHLVEADTPRVLDWEAATRGRILYGDDGLLPAVPAPVLRRVLLQHLEGWPTWVEGMTGEALAYAVLTVCRTAACLTTGVAHS